MARASKEAVALGPLCAGPGRGGVRRLGRAAGEERTVVKMLQAAEVRGARKLWREAWAGK